MSHIKDYLISKISKEVDKNGIVLWFDPERAYTEFVDGLQLQGVYIARFRDSFFSLRREVEPYLSLTERPKLLVYIPLAENQTHDALVELKQAGQSLSMPLPMIATNALAHLIGSRSAVQIGKDVQAGKLTLDELDNHPVGESITRGVVAVILGSGNVQDIALRFLAGEKHDAVITRKNATAELAMLLNIGFGSKLQPADSPKEIRADFARHVLATDFLRSLNGDVPSKLSTVRVADNEAAAKSCVHLASEWRNRQDLRESYARLADEVAKQLQLSACEFTVGRSSSSQTFRDIENGLCRDVTQKLLEGASEEIVQLAQERQSSFWSEFLPELQAHWALIAVAGQLLMESERIENEIKKSTTPPLHWSKLMRMEVSLGAYLIRTIATWSAATTISIST